MRNFFKKYLANLILVLILVSGLGIVLYPSVSNYINSKHQSKAIDNYSKQLANVKPADFEKFWKEAEAFNKRLADQKTSFEVTDKTLAEYNKLLDPTQTGIMGYLEIENIGVNLPIYHGVEETTLAVGIGHLPGSSLPTGGESTHTVLSGHRGLPSSKLLTDLDQMIVGDVFLVHVMDKTFAYQVDQINIVLPDETSLLSVSKGEDYCTLVTCTPYGVNTHRLLVRGKRIEYESQNSIIVADAVRFTPVMVAPFIAAPILFVAFLIALIRTSSKGTGTRG
ncbi:class C sortase [Butyrivibrio sp. NC3005]|uniref:class C sortase n=1 Tax=Butyrivibrio sp. NC3005 TaxID=1280685 RepID=UPI00040C819B|nr:class C sortase [Butyrivibrio sp. NC3005]